MRLDPENVTVIVSTDDDEEYTVQAMQEPGQEEPQTLNLRARQDIAEEIKQLLTGQEGRNLALYLEEPETEGIRSPSRIWRARQNKALWRQGRVTPVD